MFEEMMKMLQTAEGVAVAVSGLLAVIGLFLADGWIPGFTELLPKTKRVISLVASVVLPVVGLVLGSMAAGGLEMNWVRYADAVMVGLGVFYASQVAHTRLLPDNRE